MENWMQKFENGKEKTYEEILNCKLEELIDLVDNSKEYYSKKRIDNLEKIVDLYNVMKNIGYDFDEKDMIFRKKQLVELKYKKMKKEYMESRESDSWNEFEEEEQEVDDEER